MGRAGEVALTYREMIQGAFVGIMRHVEKLSVNRIDQNGGETMPQWQIDLEGALGEMALAKYLEVFWTGANEFRALDVGKYEVRTSAWSTGRLIVHKNDRDDAPFVLLTGSDGKYIVHGWILGADAKQDQWWADPTGKGRPAYFVPQSGLRPMEDVAKKGRVE